MSEAAATGAVAFVTGGTGFVGSHLVEALLARGYAEVRCLVRSGRKWLGDLPITEVRGDLTDPAVLEAAVQGVDYVYHVAGLTRATEWIDFAEANVHGTVRLLAAIEAVNPTVRKVLVTSSLAAIGACDVPIADETAPFRPLSMYGRSKAEMEKAIVAEGWLSRLPITIVRPPAVYGPREADIFTFFKTVKQGVAPIMGDGNRPDLSLVHVQDLVDGMIAAAEHPATKGETYFLGSAEQYSWNTIKAATTAALGRRALSIPVPLAFVKPIGAISEAVGKLLGQYPPLNRDKAYEIRHACKMCTSQKAMDAFGYAPSMPLDAGLRQTMGWYQQEGWL